QEPAHGEGVRALALIAQEISTHTPLNQEGGMRVERRTHGDHILAHRGYQVTVRDNGAAHDIAMTGCELRQAVQKNIDVVAAMVMEAGKGVVHDGETLRAPRMRRQVFDI